MVIRHMELPSKKKEVSAPKVLHISPLNGCACFLFQQAYTLKMLDINLMSADVDEGHKKRVRRQSNSFLWR